MGLALNFSVSYIYLYRNVHVRYVGLLRSAIFFRGRTFMEAYTDADGCVKKFMSPARPDGGFGCIFVLYYVYCTKEEYSTLF